MTARSTTSAAGPRTTAKPTSTEVLACGADNRLADDGWTVRIHHGTVEWIPPPELDVGRARVNFYHHHHRLLAPDDADEDDDEA